MDFFRGKTTLVTGADGFIGSHLTEALVRAGAEVRAFSLYNALGSLGWLDRCDAEVRGHFEVFIGDVRDPDGVRRAMRGCEVVLHLAALVGIPYSYHSPSSYLETNVAGMLNVVQAAREFGVMRVLQTSTSEVYGTARYVPIDEEHPLQAQSPYAASKIGADQMALSFHRSFGTPVTVVRPFNTYGPRQSARAVIPTVVMQIAAGRRRIRLGSLSPTRDFSFVADTVSGMMSLAACEAAVGESVNLGSGFEVPIGETAALIAEVMGREIEIEADPQRLRPAASEVERLWSCTDKMQRLTGWRPVYGGREGFRRGLAETAAWFSDPANLALYKTDAYAV